MKIIKRLSTEDDKVDYYLVLNPQKPIRYWIGAHVGHPFTLFDIWTGYMSFDATERDYQFKLLEDQTHLQPHILELALDKAYSDHM